MIAFPAIVVAFSYKSLFSDEIFARWIVDYIFAYPFGIVFQFFTIAPMRRLSVGKGFVAAIKAATLSLTAWQCGMYGCMAGATLRHFPNRLWDEARTNISRILVHDASCDDLWLPDLVSC